MLVDEISVQPIIVAEVVVDVRRALVDVYGGGSRTQELRRGGAAAVGSGNQRGDGFDGWVIAGRNLVQLVLGEDGAVCGQSLALFLAFVGDEEERLILENRTAEIAAVLIALEGIFPNRCAG